MGVGDRTSESIATCPECGRINRDSWEFKHEVPNEWECGGCGAMLEVIPSVKITYVTKTIQKGGTP